MSGSGVEVSSQGSRRVGLWERPLAGRSAASGGPLRGISPHILYMDVQPFFPTWRLGLRPGWRGGDNHGSSLTVGAMPPGGMSHSSGDPGRLMKAASFTSRVRQAGVSVAARDNTHLRGNFARGLVTHLHADTAIIAHMPSNVSKLQWKVWQFFEDPNSSKAVRHLLPLSWRCARWPTPPRLQRACTPSPPVRLRRSISPSS